jgi:integrase
LRREDAPNGEFPSEDPPTLKDLRDRALIGVMVYTFARVNAVIGMKVKDYFVQGRRGWVRLHEKGGKEHEVPCHHTLEKLLDEYVTAAGIAGDPLFRSVGCETGRAEAMWQQDSVPDDPAAGGGGRHRHQIGNHTFRATGITDYLKNKGTLEHAQTLANHASPHTPSSTTGARIKSRSTRWRRSGFDRQAARGRRYAGRVRHELERSGKPVAAPRGPHESRRRYNIEPPPSVPGGDMVPQNVRGSHAL